MGFRLGVGAGYTVAADPDLRPPLLPPHLQAQMQAKQMRRAAEQAEQAARAAAAREEEGQYQRKVQSILSSQPPVQWHGLRKFGAA